MNRRATFWASQPEDENERQSITIRVAGDWVAVDGRQLIMPVKLLMRNGEDLADDHKVGLLKQFGGHTLLNDMLMTDEQQFEEGSCWTIERTTETIMAQPTDL